MLVLLKVYVLALLTNLAPSKPNSELVLWADNIAEVVFQANETRQVCSVNNVVELATVGFCETGLRRDHGILYGLSCCRSSFTNLQQATVLASKILTAAHRHCGGRNLSKIFGYYHSGVCIADPYSTMQAGLANRAVRRVSLLTQ
jgi:hypothetical protein